MWAYIKEIISSSMHQERAKEYVLTHFQTVTSKLDMLVPGPIYDNCSVNTLVLV